MSSKQMDDTLHNQPCNKQKINDSYSLDRDDNAENKASIPINEPLTLDVGGIKYTTTKLTLSTIPLSLS